ncbi:hypothetical protein [Sphingomonas sp. 67-36]|nr:hypothetical protein [Sphingomonas sp. 67-36]
MSRRRRARGRRRGRFCEVCGGKSTPEPENVRRATGRKALADENGRFVAGAASAQYFRARIPVMGSTRSSTAPGQYPPFAPEYPMRYAMSEAAVEVLSDRDLLHAFQRSDCDGDEVLTAALLREIQRRGLDAPGSSGYFRPWPIAL